MKILPMVFTRKKKIFCLFHAFNLFCEKLYQNPEQFFSVIPRGVPLPHSNALQYYVKRENFKVNDVIFPSGCEARAINLGNKSMKIGSFTGGNSVRSNIIFTGNVFTFVQYIFSSFLERNGVGRDKMGDMCL